MIKKVFILNAPPRTGKDTIASDADLCGFSYSIKSFKEPLYNIAATTLGLSLPEFMLLYDTDGWKDSPQEICNNKTPRELMIHISETYIKPFFGYDYFGKQLCASVEKAFYDNRCVSCSQFVIIPDGGFNKEVVPLIEAFGNDVVEVIQLEREGYRDFGHDSRSWIDLSGVKITKFDTTKGNDGVLKYIEQQMINVSKENIGD